MRIRVARIGSRIAPDWGKGAEREIRRAIDKTKRPVVREFDKVVADWEHKPRFIAKQENFQLYVRPVGPHAKIWRYVNDGTRPHKIKARRAPFLAFQAGQYVPKTKPIGQFGGPGIVRGAKWVKTQEVNHPGTKARHFDFRISNRMAPVLAKEMRDAISRVFKRTSR